MKKKMFAGAEVQIFLRAKELRKNQTPEEDVLWNYLRQKPFGYKFRRQHPFSNYILDFYCHSLNLAVEVDGKIHEEEIVKQNDEERTASLTRQGLIIIRFTNEEVKTELEKVIERIEQYLIKKQ